MTDKSVFVFFVRAKYPSINHVPDMHKQKALLIVEDSGRILKNKLTVGPMYEDNQRTIGKDETES